jgi:2-polyprenyl-3-methyl-5-hydroxy-6-metoxy-1,4-benzoquinol methylase
MTKIPQSAIDQNRRALTWYDEKYEYYDSLFGPEPSAKREEALIKMIAKVPVDGTVLEIGSASGCDANFVERLGRRVRRTDITRGFIELQAKRGKLVDYLDILTSDYGGPYDAILAMCVMLHVAPEATDAVLANIAAALQPRGVFLVSVREVSEPGITAWSRDAFAARLAAAGLEVIWEERDFDGDQWIEFLAQKG